MSEEEKDEKYWDDVHNKVQEFHKEFKDLVRKYVPKYVHTDLLDMMQEKTSVYSPYIWSDYHE